MAVTHTSCLGGGTIGSSWAALFLANGRSVALFDPDPGVEPMVRSYIDQAWPTMTELGLTANGDPDAITFHRTAAAAVDGADFVQENVPERLPIKQATFREIEPVLKPGAIVASSASGLMLGQMQSGWHDPSRFVLGHPFNPPHLIPLVEVVGNERTAPEAVDAARDFYESAGKVTIRLNKEKNGHVANRLQAALWREAISLIVEGVASTKNVDKAVCAGPGLRWSVMGRPCSSIWAPARADCAFCDHFSDTFNGWWDDLRQVYLNDEVARLLVEGVEAASHGQTPAELSARRDALILAVRSATHAMDSGGDGLSA